MKIDKDIQDVLRVIMVPEVENRDIIASVVYSALAKTDPTHSISKGQNMEKILDQPELYEKYGEDVGRNFMMKMIEFFLNAMDEQEDFAENFDCVFYEQLARHLVVMDDFQGTIKWDTRFSLVTDMFCSLTRGTVQLKVLAYNPKYTKVGEKTMPNTFLVKMPRVKLIEKKVKLEVYLNTETLPNFSKLKNIAPNTKHQKTFKMRRLVSRGDHQEIPAEALKAINILRTNKFIVKEYDINNEDWIESVRESLEKKDYGETKVRDIITQQTRTRKLVLEMFKNSEIYFDWFFDVRGRLYSVGYDIHLQSHKAGKSMILPHPKNKGMQDMLTERGKYWLMVDLANHMGLDKLLFDDRVKWVEKNKKTIEALANNKTNFRTKDRWGVKQEYVVESLEWTNAYEGLKRDFKGLPAQRMMYLDASNSGMQIYSALTGDAVGASHCNLNNKKEMADAYQFVAQFLNNHFETNIFNRKNCKKCVMITFYGSKNGYKKIVEKLALEGISVYIELDIEVTEEDDTDKLSEAVMEALDAMCPNVMRTMNLLLEINKTMVAKSYSWTMPDGFPVTAYNTIVGDIELDTEQLSKLNNLTKSNKEVGLVKLMSWKRRQPDDSSAGIAPNIIHSIDAYVLKQMVIKMNAKGHFITVIHDAFACHPNACDDMIEIYKEEMVNLLRGNLLKDITDQIINRGISDFKEKLDTIPSEDYSRRMDMMARVDSLISIQGKLGGKCGLKPKMIRGSIYPLG